MANVTEATVEHVAGLARLSLTAEEKARFARQLQQILEYAESIQALDVTGVPPMSHAGLETPLRAEPAEPQPGLAREAALDAAPDAADGLFRVPKVIGG
jgi:aspartyl-tRNA(Asn)/glutamyl-tRNA(Gln) amidotransferase subunit C